MPRDITSVIAERTAEISPTDISSVFEEISATPMVKEHLAQAQRDDPIIGHVLVYKGQGKNGLALSGMQNIQKFVLDA